MNSRRPGCVWSCVQVSGGPAVRCDRAWLSRLLYFGAVQLVVLRLQRGAPRFASRRLWFDDLMRIIMQLGAWGQSGSLAQAETVAVTLRSELPT